MSAPIMMTKPVVCWYADEVITSAIGHIQRNAAVLRESHTSHEDREDWGTDVEAKADYEAMSQSVRELRGLLTALRGPEPVLAQIDRGEDGRGQYELAEDVVRQDGGASPATLGRALGIDAVCALQLLTQLERGGVVGPANDDGYREVRAA